VGAERARYTRNTAMGKTLLMFTIPGEGNAIIDRLVNQR
jgi:hypothetical protein